MNLKQIHVNTCGRLEEWFPPEITQHPEKMIIGDVELATIVDKTKPHYLGEINQITTLSQTDRSILYCLTVTNNKTFVLKLSHKWNTHASIAYEYRILNILSTRQCSLVIPQPLAYYEDDCRAWILREYIPGNQMSDLLGKDYATEAQKLRCLHLTGQTLSTLHTTVEPDVSGKQCLDFALARAAHNLSHDLYDLEEFNDIDTPDRVFSWLCNNRPFDLKASLLHGDFRPKNIFVQDFTQPAVLIDWEHSMLGDPYYDLAIFAYYCKTHEGMDSFLSGYGLQSIDVEKLHYFDLLSKFLNI